MSHYKIQRRVSPRERAQIIYRKIRLATVLISCLLFSLTIALLLYGHGVR